MALLTKKTMIDQIKNRNAPGRGKVHSDADVAKLEAYFDSLKEMTRNELEAELNR